MALAGVTTTEAANRWLAATYIAEYNRLFAVVAALTDTAFVASTAGVWREILCVQEERTVGNDNTVSWHKMHLQLPPSRLRPHFVKAVVSVHAYPDGTVAIYLGPHRLADFGADGQTIEIERQVA